MKIELRVDGYSTSIESRIPDTVARWLIEQFESIHWTPATWCQVYVWPSFSEDGKADYFTNSNYLYEPYTGVKNAREFALALSERIDYHLGSTT